MRLYFLSVLDVTDITCACNPSKEPMKHTNLLFFCPDNITKAWIWTAAEAVLYVICACLPSVYSFFRMLAGKTPTKKSSRPTATSKRQLITIGSEPSKFSSRTKTTDEEDQSEILGQMDYQVICEPAADGDWHSMRDMEPVRVRREVAVVSQ